MGWERDVMYNLAAEKPGTQWERHVLASEEKVLAVLDGYK